jgi:NAD(P)H dehydrogenase (quinone)
MNILILNGYPGNKGLSYEIVERYKKKNSLGNEIRVINIIDLKFHFVLRGGYSGENIFEKDLEKAQKDILWADKLVFVFPIWWGGVPSLFKSFIERTFLPGFAFKYVNGKPQKLLKGKTAEIIATAGGPRWYYNTLGIIDQKRTLARLLNFCGIKVKRIRVWGGIGQSSKKEYIEKILKSI